MHVYATLGVFPPRIELIIITNRPKQEPCSSGTVHNVLFPVSKDQIPFFKIQILHLTWKCLLYRKVGFLLENRIMDVTANQIAAFTIWRLAACRRSNNWRRNKKTW